MQNIRAKYKSSATRELRKENLENYSQSFTLERQLYEDHRTFRNCCCFTQHTQFIPNSSPRFWWWALALQMRNEPNEPWRRKWIHTFYHSTALIVMFLIYHSYWHSASYPKYSSTSAYTPDKNVVHTNTDCL